MNAHVFVCSLSVLLSLPPSVEAVAQFDYAAREPDELTLKKGDVITDVRPMPDGWMEGYKDGKKGMFPDNFVKVPCLPVWLFR